MLHKLRQAKFGIRLTVLSLFIMLTTLVVAVALCLQFYFSQSLAKDAARGLFNHTAQNVSEKIANIDSESSAIALLLSEFPDVDSREEDHNIRPIISVMAQAMRQRSYLHGIYIGYKNGDFYELINLNTVRQLSSNLDADVNDRWTIVKIQNTDKGRIQYQYYYDDQFNLTHQSQLPSQYFANVRPWYKDAMNSPNETIKTAPYFFHSIRSSGITYAKQIDHTGNVVAVDISLADMSAYLQQNLPFAQSSTFIFNQAGKISAQSMPTNSTSSVTPTKPIPLTEEQKQYIANLGVLTVSNELDWAPFDFAYSGMPKGYSIDVMNLIAEKTGLKFEYVNGYSWNQLLGLFQSNKLDIVQSIFETPARQLLGDFTIPYRNLSTVLITRKGHDVGATLGGMGGEVIAIPTGWALTEKVQQQFPDIDVLKVKSPIDGLQAVVDGKADAALETQEVAEYFIRLNNMQGLEVHTGNNGLRNQGAQQLSILITKRYPKLRDIFNQAIQSITAQESAALEQKWLSDNMMSSMQRLMIAGMVPAAMLQQIEENTSSKNGEQSLVRTQLDGKDYILYVEQLPSNAQEAQYLGIIVPTAVIQSPNMDRVYISILITFGFLILLSPLIYHFANTIVDPIKSLSLENDKIRHRQFSAVNLVPSRIQELDQLSKSIHSMAGDLKEHQYRQQQLMDSFIQLIAQAIDQKSPYTGGHCARVPVIANMLAESAHLSHAAEFKDFHFVDEEQRREFQVASWLHDCGKVTTPEHIIDKGSKLETIYNRIHEIRMRFEVLRRDAEINSLKERLAGGDERELNRELLSRYQQLDEQFAFIAQCNVGSEFMDDEKIARIHQIGKQTWVRHFSDRDGLSPEENKRLAQIPEQELPVTEPLLADKAEHIQPWITDPHNLLSADMKMTVPEVQANLGELHNLSIQRGTLTASDRYRINEHIIATIHMLESLPLPPELKRVPEIAGGHHETLIGTGYPKKLSGNELSIEARILAIADVFEALTAADRPYKKAKTLSQSIAILAKMAEDQHLDKELFKLLLTSGIYRDYAELYLEPNQIDEVDIEPYLT
ncbi:HD domain-containing phosphohydrolase [Vibrio nitrifigilis]|uniref:Transporter substrate-binding domain-containing protein n=1 Tax=Vibrio nitrifigilis TaxID=2789781 RepID=A0ABS0GKT3_9VIBR|nr:HD domain-containing phosphohydrolase [Vibrio nitrifigilis]MBF9002930.1 transporter substrate-binding domain-containing protein [Vibrio nitrifigilis]